MLLCLMLTSLLFKSYLSYQANARITAIRSDMNRRLPGFALHSTPSATLLHSSIVDGIPVEILDMLHDKYKGPGGLQILLPELFSACRMIGTALREGIFTADKTGIPSTIELCSSVAEGVECSANPGRRRFMSLLTVAILAFA